MIENKIYVCCHSLGRGGAERVLSILSNVFIKHYKEVVYICWFSNKTVAYNINPKVKIIWIEKEIQSRQLLKKIFWFRCFVKQNCPSILLSFLTPINMIVLTSLLGMNKNIVVSERNDPHLYFRKYRFESLLCVFRNFLYHKSKGIIVQSQSIKDYYKGLLKNKCSIIYNPINMDKTMVGAALDKEKENRIVTVGRLEPQKNHKLLIEAFSLFCKTHINFRLEIYGEGSCRKELEEYILSLGLKEKVLLHGVADDIFHCITSAKVFVLSSIYEGMSNALIEAMSLGLPCISTKVSGAVDLIENGVNGILIDCGDVTQLVGALNKICTNEEYANMLGNNAVSVYNTLNVDVISNKWIEYLNLHLQK